MAGRLRAAALVEKASDRVRIMMGGHLRPENVQAIAAATGAREFHASLRVPVASPVTYRHPSLRLGNGVCEDYSRYSVFAEDVRLLRGAIDGIGVQERLADSV